ncbi:acyl carrier protein [Bacteroides intestinalis]|jgi:acyl carrier protein|uniref:Acyl carrier protein n=1 Tax=Bacteroides intestinalis TaxID=329854 RepID=A0A412XVC3_9BACE|nr:acyl carrier protein [Bacteroides intestinalis]RGV49067.1 acyl carrier protein [Bacteroides intestinalis]RHA54735.1 acyl carrier protein [Bacteroides intestinalis]
MELQKFIQDFVDQFEDMNVDELTVNTEFKSLDEWSSLAALSIIAMIDDEYEVSVNGNDIRNSETIGDLFELIKSKK